MSTAERLTYTPEQYLALDRKTEYRSEYRDGFIVAMSGASREHNLIALNLGAELRSQLRDRPCETYVRDMRVRVRSGGPYAYPDVVVVCGEAQFEDEELDTLLNPTVIVEVLSPTTEAYDRGQKFARYRRLPSLREYVLASQDRMLIERYARQDETWVLTEFSDPDDVLTLPSIGCEVPLREIYARVTFPDEGPRLAEEETTR